MPLSREEAVTETLRCEQSFAYFYFNYCRIEDDKQGSILPQRWPHSIEIAESWPTGKSFIEGKGRQLGYSWELAGYDNWVLRFRRNARILSISLGERESKRLLYKVKFIYDHLPTFLKLRKNVDNESEFGFLKTGSSMIALPSTKQAGRSEKATLVQTDEWAFHPYAGENFAAYRSAIADGGQHIAVSTGNGPTGMFYEFFNDPKAPYTKRFYPWSARPDRDEEWYERERTAFLAAGDRHPLLFIRENPSSVEEMFTAFFGLVYEDFKPEKHQIDAPFRYEDSKWRIAAVDPGQGDPAAVSIIGESEEGHAHQFGPEFYQQGVTTAQDIYAYLSQWYRKAPLHGVVVDGAEGTLVATLNAWFKRDFGREPVYPANKDRGIGIAHVASRLRSNNFTIDAQNKHTLREFQSYRWKERTAPGEADTYTTSTPIDHHGDLMDTIRYALVHLSQYYSNVRPVRADPPTYQTSKSQQKKEVIKPNRQGEWVDPEAKRLTITNTSSDKMPMRRIGYVGPDYRRARMNRMTGRRR